jgi:hypothetical protein
MYEDKPDRFGKYRDKISKIHYPICTKICHDFSLDLSMVEMPIHQMSIFEYVSEKHDEDYTYFLYGINGLHSTSKNPDFFINVNNKFLNELFSKKYFEFEMIKTISEIWSFTDKNKIVNYSITRKFEIKNNDVIQSVHIFYKGEQLFKIIYFYDSFRKILED